MYVFNAENEMSPLIKAGSNVFKTNSERSILDGLRNKRKQFPEYRYGNNVESPNFLRMPNVYDNAYSKNSVHDKNSYRDSSSNMIIRPADSYILNSYTHSQDNNFPKDMEKYMTKLTTRMKNVLVEDSDKEMQTLTKQSTYNPKKSQTEKRPETNSSPSQNVNKVNTNRQILHKEIFESAPYLNNINEYNIKESDNVNEERIFKYNKKNIEDFNCVIGKKVSMSPPKYAVDKWPLFYEKYYILYLL